MYHIFLETSEQMQIDDVDVDVDQDVLQVQGCSLWLYLQQIPMYNIFLETSEQIHIADVDSCHLNIHQKDHDYQDVFQVQGCS